MATVAIVAHSRAGNTWRLAEAVSYGVSIADANAHLIRIDEEGAIDEADWDMLALADGIIFGCPTHMGGPSWQFKRFADSTIRVWRPTLWRDKFAGGFTNSTGMSGDKFATLTYFWTLAMQQGMVWIGSGMKPAFAYDKAAPRESVNYIGGYGGAMATNPFGDPQKMSPADVATAAAFGQRFATFVAAGRTPNTPYVDLTRPRVSKPSAS
ncbi:flavodoxin family protein [Mycolicibacterium goodii]|uniref:Flavodoxin family protein n=1 Tax=Mycolicibacterium goodii TaxID=134601 RepID=A0ABS6HVA9_MYCGD|nr:flavodoxin family protein [Mycolicibacterium goodii]MBU8826621.1 flavodoxin family protein [Mycolicibacterium goodii]MBU8840009.1 flavodoxin family protein [Mycolicibacterium goodii]